MRNLLRLVLALVMGAMYAPELQAQTPVEARGAMIELGGRVHSRFQTSSVDGFGPTFLIRRARLEADVTVSERIEGRVHVDVGDGGASLTDAWVGYRPAPGIRISMGQFKRAFDLFELDSSTQLPILERDGRIPGVDTCPGVGGVCSYGRFISKLRLGGRDRGLRLEVDRGRIGFAATLTNGEGANTPDPNGARSGDARVTVQATDRLVLGGGVALRDRAEDTGTEYASAWSADLEWGARGGGAHLQAALAGGENWRLDPDADFLAWQVVGSWFAPVESDALDGVEPLLRLSSGDPDTTLDDDGGFLFTPGFMIHLTGRNRIGFNLDVWSPAVGDRETSLKVQSFLYF